MQLEGNQNTLNCLHKFISAIEAPTLDNNRDIGTG